MKKKILLSIFLTFVIGLTHVNAETTFTDGNKTYTIEEQEISCIQSMFFNDLDENGNYLFYNEEEHYYRLTSNNTCEKLSNQEILDMMNQDYFYYNLNSS